VTLGWRTYLGHGAEVVGVDRFGASAPGGRVLQEYGFNVENVVQRALQMVGSES
jgi:transketolase